MMVVAGKEKEEKDAKFKRKNNCNCWPCLRSNYTMLLAID